MNIKSLVATVAAIGAVRRKGIAGLEAYGGTVEGKGEVIHKSGPKKGKKTKFTLSGRAGSRR